MIATAFERTLRRINPRGTPFQLGIVRAV